MSQPTNDFFVQLSHNKVADLILRTTANLEILYVGRHDYPMWPAHGGNPSDVYEEGYCRPPRKAYYSSTLAFASDTPRTQNLGVALP